MRRQQEGDQHPVTVFGLPESSGYRGSRLLIQKDEVSKSSGGDMETWSVLAGAGAHFMPPQAPKTVAHGCVGS